MRRAALVFIACALAASLASPAAARENKKKKGWIPEPLRSSFGLTSYLWSAKQVGTTIPTTVIGHNEVSDGVVVDIRFPFTFTVAPNPIIPITDKKVIGGLGNITAGAHYAHTSSIVTWFVGGALSAPLATIHDVPLRFADGLGADAMAGWDLYLWTPAYFPFEIFGGAEFRVAEPLAIRLSLEPYYLIPIEGGATFQIFSQEKIEAEARAKNGFGGGLSFQAVTRYTNIPGVGGDGTFQDDRAALSTSAFLGYDDAESFFFRLGALLALDHPFGFGFDTQKTFSGFLSIGGYFSGYSADD